MPGTLGELTKTAKGIAPQAAADGTINGTGIDRSGFDSAVVCCETGASTGTPTAVDVDFKVQDSADNSTFSDIPGAVKSNMASNQHGQIEVDLRGLRQYIRVVCTVTHTGGTTPTTQVSASVILGDPAEAPQA